MNLWIHCFVFWCLRLHATYFALSILGIFVLRILFFPTSYVLSRDYFPSNNESKEFFLSETFIKCFCEIKHEKSVIHSILESKDFKKSRVLRWLYQLTDIFSGLISRSAHRTPNFTNSDFFVYLLFECFFQKKVLNWYQNIPKNGKISIYVKKKKTLCNTLNCWNWNSGVVKLVVWWAE